MKIPSQSNDTAIIGKVSTQRAFLSSCNACERILGDIDPVELIRIASSLQEHLRRKGYETQVDRCENTHGNGDTASNSKTRLLSGYWKLSMFESQDLPS